MGKPRLRETTCSATVEPQLSREIIPVCGTIKLSVLEVIKKFYLESVTVPKPSQSLKAEEED